jgi:UDP-N-acetylglucosamine 4,6-dehydratase/5-epimerase
MFNNKSILITGGTGSFGKNFTRIILNKYKPKKVIIFSRDEQKQFEMFQELKKFEKSIRYFIGDVRDQQRLKLAMNGVDFVVHAAAMKHVPAAEYNPQECIKTNILGAENVINASLDCKVKKVIALSTDKAANPINLYGATKLAADKLFVSANNLTGMGITKFSVVRYGNVIGSRGSVLPFFLNLLKKKQKYLPITDKRMTRFWISLDEGVNFVFQSFKKMIGGEIFVPKIPSINIVDLARALDSKITLKTIGIRPGEKIHELLSVKDEARNTYEIKDSYFILPSTISENKKKLFLKNYRAKKVKENFEYSSGSNKIFLNINQIKKIISSN